MKIFIIHEIEGGSILGAFKCYEDARCFLYFGEYEGSILAGYYRISEVLLK